MWFTLLSPAYSRAHWWPEHNLQKDLKRIPTSNPQDILSPYRNSPYPSSYSKAILSMITWENCWVGMNHHAVSDHWQELIQVIFSTGRLRGTKKAQRLPLVWRVDITGEWGLGQMESSVLLGNEPGIFCHIYMVPVSINTVKYFLCVFGAPFSSDFNYLQRSLCILGVNNSNTLRQSYITSCFCSGSELSSKH